MTFSYDPVTGLRQVYRRVSSRPLENERKGRNKTEFTSFLRCSTQKGSTSTIEEYLTRVERAASSIRPRERGLSVVK